MTPESMQAMSSMAMAEMEPGTEFHIKTIPQGAATSLWAGVTAPAESVGGRYCADCQVAEVGEVGGNTVRSYAVDPERARQLWSVSERLVGESYPGPGRAV
jgi:hypothetical protein